jgi:hypothetical protein
MIIKRAPRPFAPHFKDRDALHNVCPQDLAEHVDVAFAEFMTAISHCIAGVTRIPYRTVCSRLRKSRYDDPTRQRSKP